MAVEIKSYCPKCFSEIKLMEVPSCAEANCCDEELFFCQNSDCRSVFDVELGTVYDKEFIVPGDENKKYRSLPG